MKKKEWEKKSASRLNAVKTSFNNKLYDESVADSGLVVEFSLKAVICKFHKNKVYPEQISNYRTHDCEKLIDLAKLREDLDKEKHDNIEFFVNWSLMSKWSINFRYEPPGKYNEKIAKDYINALESESGGVYKGL